MSFRYYWEDFPAGRIFEHGRRTLGEAEIIGFARQWDPQRFHVDPQAAKDTPFGGLVASGWHTGCLAGSRRNLGPVGRSQRPRYVS